jgi:uncharacterized protein
MSVISGTLSSSDGIVISYRHFVKNHNSVIIGAHGFYDSKDSALSKKLEQGLIGAYDVFLFDFRGHGESSGVFTWTSREGDDLKAVLNHLRGRYEKIGLIGYSMGGSISINVLAELADSGMVNSFVCVSAPSEVTKIDYRLWELNPENEIIYSLFTKEGRKGKGVRPGPFWLDKQRPVDSIKKVKIPVLFIHGTKDWLVKPWHSQALFDNAPGQKKIISIEDGPHAEYLLLKHSGEFFKAVLGWFADTLGEGMPAPVIPPENIWKLFWRNAAETAAKAMGKVKGWFNK